MKQRFSRDPQVEHSLRHSLRDGVAYSVMSGGAETYFSAFAVFLRANAAQIGLLASLPPLLGSFAQLLSSWIARRTGERRKVILSGALLQGAALLPLAVLPLLFRDQAVMLLITFVIVYHVGANLAAPQWSSLMGELVPERRRGRFFALRTRLSSLTAFASLIGAGLLLHFTTLAGWTAAGYVALFVVAAAARGISIHHLARMHNPPGQVAALETPVSRRFWERLRHSPFARFSIYFAAMQCAVAVASPFFTVYMLRDLHFSYLQFTVNTAASVLAQILMLNTWGRLGDVFGNRRILTVTGWVIPFLPSLWVISDNFAYLVAVQVLSGLAWSGFTLSAGNSLYDLVPPPRRATYLAMHNALAAVGLFVGATLGGLLAVGLRSHSELFGTALQWTSPLYGVFVLSTLLRIVVAATFLRRIEEVRSVRRVSVSGLIYRVARYNALSGLVFDWIGARRRRERGL